MATDVCGPAVLRASPLLLKALHLGGALRGGRTTLRGRRGFIAPHVARPNGVTCLLPGAGNHAVAKLSEPAGIRLRADSSANGFDRNRTNAHPGQPASCGTRRRTAPAGRAHQGGGSCPNRSRKSRARRSPSVQAAVAIHMQQRQNEQRTACRLRNTSPPAVRRSARRDIPKGSGRHATRRSRSTHGNQKAYLGSPPARSQAAVVLVKRL